MLHLVAIQRLLVLAGSPDARVETVAHAGVTQFSVGSMELGSSACFGLSCSAWFGVDQGRMGWAILAKIVHWRLVMTSRSVSEGWRLEIRGSALRNELLPCCRLYDMRPGGPMIPSPVRLEEGGFSRRLGPVG